MFPQEEAITTVQVGLALGGGGARGLAHLGVLKVLEEEDIPVNMIAGTSIGAMIGAVYAQTPDIEAITERIRSYLRSLDYEIPGLKNISGAEEDDLPTLQRFARTIARRIYISSIGSRSSILKPDALDSAIRYLLDDSLIEDTQISFGAVATDLNSGEALLIREGSIRRAVRRSALIPAFFPPEVDGKRLVADGAVTRPVPVEFVRSMGADIVIAVSADPTILSPLEDRSIISIMQRCDLIRGLQLSRLELEKADVIIHPDVADCHWSCFTECDRFVEEGVKEAKHQLSKIRNAIKVRRGWLPRLMKILSKGER